MRTIFLLPLVAVAAFPQALSVGVKGGAPLGDAFKIASNAASGRSYFENTKRYTIGPTVDIRLPMGLGIEFDALYKRVEYGYSASQVVAPPSPGQAAPATARVDALTKGNSWEFPLLLKYRSPGVLVRPYVSGGVSFRSLRNLKQFITTEIPALARGATTTQTNTPEELQERFNKGLVFGGGIDVKALVLHVSPELRYTRWVDRGFRDALKVFGSNQNQFEFLIGLTF